MTVMLELSPEREAELNAQAKACGFTLAEWLIELTDQHTPIGSIAHLQKTDPDEWAHQFDAFIDSHDPDTPILSDEAMNRASIYPDHA